MTPGGPDVCVVGSLITDLCVYAARRPEPGETVIGSRFETFLGGKGFNQAVASARLGAKTAMVGRLGDDEFAQRFLHVLDREHINRAHVTVDPGAGTGVGLPLIEESGENSIVVVPRANDHMTPAAIRAAAVELCAASVILLQLELPLPATLLAAQMGREAGRTVVLNPAPARSAPDIEQLVGCADVLVPNRIEAAQLLGGPERPAANAAAELARRYDCEVVVTLGAEGVIVAGARTTEHHAAHDVHAVDSVGAGDAFCGALGAALASGMPLGSAVGKANAAAALAVTKRGAEPSLPTADEIAALLAAP